MYRQPACGTFCSLQSPPGRGRAPRPRLPGARCLAPPAATALPAAVAAHVHAQPRRAAGPGGPHAAPAAGGVPGAGPAAATGPGACCNLIRGRSKSSARAPAAAGLADTGGISSRAWTGRVWQGRPGWEQLLGGGAWGVWGGGDLQAAPPCLAPIGCQFKDCAGRCAPGWASSSFHLVWNPRCHRCLCAALRLGMLHRGAISSLEVTATGASNSCNTEQNTPTPRNQRTFHPGLLAREVGARARRLRQGCPPRGFRQQQQAPPA